MQPEHLFLGTDAKSKKTLTQYPQTTVTIISVPLIPEDGNTRDRRQWVHLRMTRILYFFRGDYFVEGFLSENYNPENSVGTPIPAEWMELKLWIDDPVGFNTVCRESNSTQCTFNQNYSGETDFCTRHRLVAQLTVKMPGGWAPDCVETEQIAIG